MAAPSADHERWLRVGEFCEAENLKRREAYWLIDQGCPHSRIGNRIRIRRSDYHRFLEAHLRGATGGDR